MFGYLTVCRDELKIRDERLYKAYYCGICQELKERHGQLPRLTLNYDMTFLALLLQGLYEDPCRTDHRRCMPHPVKPHSCIRCRAVSYAADMNLLLSYYDILDDWTDEGKVSALLLSGGIKGAFLKAAGRYPRQTRAIRTYLKALKDCEAQKVLKPDLAARLTGELMAEIFVMEQDAFEPILRRLGYAMGRFIYLLDAYCDRRSDLIRGSYNPLEELSELPDYEALAAGLLKGIAADMARAFEDLPIEENADILRNILYCGIWSSYWKEKQDKEKDEKGK